MAFIRTCACQLELFYGDRMICTVTGNAKRGEKLRTDITRCAFARLFRRAVLRAGTLDATSGLSQQTAFEDH